MNPEYVADTMAMILCLEQRRMPPAVKEIFQNLEKGLTTLAVPAMGVAELAYLSEKKRIQTNLPELFKYVADHECCSIAPLTGDIIQHAFKIYDIPELHDRLIAATTLHFNSILITNDPIIRASVFLQTIW